ncbi:MAG: hypothetical protein GY866_17635, partial [Proteobacteria bacterium]|nr:hypothetical protein [Pseudomonadota bacterium]
MRRIYFIIILLILPWQGCKDINSPQEATQGRFSLNLGSLQHQAGVSNDEEESMDLTDSPASQVRTLIVGAMQVTKRDVPYTKNTLITDETVDRIQEDLQRSKAFFTLVQLPSQDDFIDIEVPSVFEGNWQVVIIGTREKTADLDALEKKALKESITFIGFNEKFHTGTEVGGEPLECTLKRTCLITLPARGCAVFNQTKNAVVTASVEIVDLEINGVQATSTLFPIVVRDEPVSGYHQQKIPSETVALLESLIEDPDQVTSLEISTTHTQNSSESSACRELADLKSVSASQLRTACQVQTNSISGFPIRRLWESVADSAEFPARKSHGTLSFQDKLWVIAGEGVGSLMNDVWSSQDGESWSLSTGNAAFTPRRGHTVLAANQKMWLIGGQDDSGYLNDVWYSEDGSNWLPSTGSAAFSARKSHTSVVFNDKIWVVGGYGSSGRFNDVWNSEDGVVWSQSTPSAAFSARNTHASLVWDDKIWVLGGYDGVTRNDAWHSTDGAAWTALQMETSFPARNMHQSLVYEEKIWIIGGYDAGFAKNDVWYSLDAANWSTASDQ